MIDFENIIEAFFALFIVFLLGYIFLLVFWQLSPLLSVLFAFVIAAVVFGILAELFRRR